jgi:hypothetical protein
MTGDQDLIDVITNVNRDLRHDEAFIVLLRHMTDQEARELAARYIRFLYESLGLERADDE